jgi:hypothetical protein
MLNRINAKKKDISEFQDNETVFKAITDENYSLFTKKQ